MKTIQIAENPLDLSSWKKYEAQDVCAFLFEHFDGIWPETAKIYLNEVNQENDVTPCDAVSVEALQKMEGEFFVVVYPAKSVVKVVGKVFSAVLGIFSFFRAPSVPTPAIRLAANRQQTSPNNELSNRTNTARLNGRIPDIFGQVRSTPDLIAVPYKVYKNHIEVETSFMCIGKGEYDVEDIKDGETPVIEIAGSSVEVYAPFTSPNSGDSPQLTVGSSIGEVVVKAVSFDSVNGQTLRPPNANNVNGNNNIRFVYPDIIEVSSGANIDFTNFFATSDALTVGNSAFSEPVQPFTTSYSCKFTYAGEIVFQTFNPVNTYQAGDIISLSSASRTDGVNPVNLAGSYTVSSVTSTKLVLTSPSTVNADWNILDNWTDDETGYAASTVGISSGTRAGDLNGVYNVVSVSSTQITLSNPTLVNANWNKIDQLNTGRTIFKSPTLQTSGPKWIGPFFLDVTDLEKVYGNFVALNGLYKDDGSNQTRFDVTVEMELTPVNSAGTAIGAAETFQGIIQGSATLRSTRAITIKADPTFTGRCKVRARRITNADLTFNGSVVDEIKWQQVYSISPVTQTDFGNVTTVLAQTYATSGALAVKDRKINMLVTRKIPTRISGSTFTTSLSATKSADEILSFICLDPYIGNRSPHEIDFDSIYNSIAEIKAYFGFTQAGEFCYTFDSANLSFEECVQALANAVFCTPYRQGNLLKLNFEKSTDDSVLIFNHRNKIPQSETRTISFGNQDNYDGVEVEYISPVDDVSSTIYIPSDRSAINPQQVETLGVRDEKQAFAHAWRVWNKILYQNVATEFQATQEAALAILNSRILVADNTRPHVQDGEVISQTGLTLTLSQKIEFEVGQTYTIFLQHVDGTVESIAVTAGTEDNQVVLGSAPSASLSLDISNYARATYIITKNEDRSAHAFLLSEKEGENGIYTLSAVNYSNLYYQQDRLELWLNFFYNNFEDNSPYGRNGVGAGGATTVLDPVRGISYLGTSVISRINLPAFNAPASYTKMCWIKKADNSSHGNILSSASASNEVFYITIGNVLSAGHNGTFNHVSAAYPTDNEWHHVTLTYNADTLQMKLYLDGVFVSLANSVPQRVFGNLQAFGYFASNGLIGRANDLRLYKSVLSDFEIKDIYRASLL